MTKKAKKLQLLGEFPSGGLVSPEEIRSALEDYLKENPIEGGVDFKTDETLALDPETKILRVNTTDQMEQDNTRPMTSAGVYATVGNIEALLKTI